MKSMDGILNGTTNFILDAMTKNGSDYGEILAEAQRLGYAEADPTADVEGYDARRKLVLSANVAFGVVLKEDDIPCFGIATVSASDITTFTEHGLVCRLIASAEQTEDHAITATVEPTLFPANAAEAAIAGSGNHVVLYAKHIGIQSFSGAGAGGLPTGSNVLCDCLNILDGCRKFYTDKFIPTSAAGSILRRYYIRTAAEISVEIEDTMGNGIITAPISAVQAHCLAAELRRQDGSTFMAALR